MKLTTKPDITTACHTCGGNVTLVQHGFQIGSTSSPSEMINYSAALYHRVCDQVNFCSAHCASANA